MPNNTIIIPYFLLISFCNLHFCALFMVYHWTNSEKIWYFHICNLQLLINNTLIKSLFFIIIDFYSLNVYFYSFSSRNKCSACLVTQIQFVPSSNLFSSKYLYGDINATLRITFWQWHNHLVPRWAGNASRPGQEYSLRVRVAIALRVVLPRSLADLAATLTDSFFFKVFSQSIYKNCQRCRTNCQKYRSSFKMSF